LNYFTCKEGVILEEKAIIERLMELDNRANKISEKRKKQLEDLKNKYKEEEQKIIMDYMCQIKNETKSTSIKILQEAQMEVKRQKVTTKEILETMERKFEKYQKNISDNILKKILYIKKEKNE